MGSSILCFWRKPSFLGFCKSSFFLSFFGDRFFESCSRFFPFIRQEHLSWKFFKGLLYFLSAYSTIVIENLLISPSSVSMEVFIFCLFFNNFLSRLLYNGTFFLRHALFLLGFCSFISFKGFLACLFI